MQLTCFSVSQAAWLEEVQILNYGRYSAQTDSEISQDDAQTKLSLLSELKLKQKTTRIPAEVGSRFGVEVELQGRPLGEKIPLRVIVEHPRIINPKTGESAHSVSWSLYPRLGDIIYAGWEFIADYECVPGQWTIRLEQDKRRLAEQDFLVFVPEKRKEPPQQSRPQQQDAKRTYLVQTGVFTNPEYAHEHMQKLRKLGYEPCILLKDKAEDELYFIFISAEATQRAAEETAGKFKETTGMGVYVNLIESSRFQSDTICPQD